VNAYVTTQNPRNEEYNSKNTRLVHNILFLLHIIPLFEKKQQQRGAQ